jgi:hypothetical protein
MLTKAETTELGRIRRDLKVLRDGWAWPCDPAAVAELCGRAFASLDALAHHFNTPLGVCFRPGQERVSGPAAVCCRALKAISDLHSSVCDEEHAGEESHAVAALDRLLQSFTTLSKDAGAEAAPAKAKV